MGKREIIIISILILVLVAINVISYVRRENLKRNYVVLVEEGVTKISINDAEVEELEALPGIGPVLAHRIVEYRYSNGQFEKLEDLKQVKGLGDKLFQNILPYIKL